MRETHPVAVAELNVARALVEAIVARQVGRAADLLHPEIDFRAMTPNRVWEAEGREGVETILRQWFEDPDEEIHRIEATETVAIEDTLRVGWLVHISDADGPHVFEQQAYVRERDGRVGWLRVMCSGWIPLGDPSAQAPTA
ncbi:MAG: hypothetical protein QOI80_2629 [Solirubrobacteraceae bacterium]|jgi:hypothetical protein|nr:hypothetical protein [Solirubrobacteraceae bacterium]